MKVELECSLRKALLKRWLWMIEGSGEGGEDEASQQHRLFLRQLATAKKRDRNFTIFNYL